ncbi:MAG: hypothetical protein ACP5VS_17980, partial [Desulfomonilaceae bacterium]
MKKFWLCSMMAIILFLLVVPASAWDFSVEGEFEWRYRYFGRANGYKDLFGDMRFQDSPFNNTGAVIGFAGPNFWRGYNGQAASETGMGTPIPSGTAAVGRSIMIARGGFSFADSDGSENDQRMIFLPKIEVDKALYFWGRLSLDAIRQRYNHRDFQTNGPLDPWFQSGLSLNAFDTAMKPSIDFFACSVQLPWGQIFLGPRPGGIGSVSLQRAERSHAALQILVPYGPFTFQAHTWYYSSPPMGFGEYTPYTGTGPGPNVPPDLDRERFANVFWSFGVMYGAGPIQWSLNFLQNLRHVPYVYLGVVQSNGIRVTYPNGPFAKPLIYNFGGEDFALLAVSFALRYNNGSVFANLEWDQNYWDTYYLPVGKTPAGHISSAPPLFQEFSLIVTECGIMTGPAKFGVLCALAGGTALNNGNPTKAHGAFDLDHTVSDAYNYLIFHTYGGGNDAPWAASNGIFNPADSVDDNGDAADAFILASRLDYAVAANLNVWGSYMWARRAEQNGWLAGQKSSNGTPALGTGPPNNAWTVIDAQNWKQ